MEKDLEKLQKIKVRENIDYYFDWDTSAIEEIRKDLDELEKLGCAFITVAECDHVVNFNAYSERLETDEELHFRNVDYNITRRHIKEVELENLKLLAKKYNKTIIDK